MRVHPIPTAILALGALAFAAPAAAQSYVSATSIDGPYVDEVIVPGPSYSHGRAGSLSRAVSIADLDLATYGGQQIMKMRVRDTARDLCRILGEGRGAGGSLLPSCEDQAVRDARPQMRLAVKQAYARTAYAYLDSRYYPYADTPY
jgi:UrcA family protein